MESILDGHVSGGKDENMRPELRRRQKTGADPSHLSTCFSPVMISRLLLTLILKPTFYDV